MQVSNKLFNEQQIRQFGKLTEDIQKKQERIASGKAILQASDDPVVAVRLSAAKEQKELLQRFDENAYQAGLRLEAADSVLQEATNVLTRVTELATQARSPVFDGFSRRAILTEIDALRESLVDLANSRDAFGQSLFSGFNVKEDAFTRQPDGSINYNGDRGQHTVKVSESVKIATGLDGESVFGRVETANGPRSVFEIIDSVAAAIDPLRDIKEFASTQGQAAIRFSLPRQNQDWSVRLTGALGSAEIKATLSEGQEQVFVDAVNAQSDLTGITAKYDRLENRIILTDPSSGEIKIDQIEIEGQDMAVRDNRYFLDFRAVDSNGKEIGVPRILADEDQLIGRGIENLKNSIDHLSIQQSLMGAQMAKADLQRTVIENRKLAINQDISKMGDADLATLVTELQQQLTNKDAAQQAFAKIGQQSLFDFIR